VPDVLLDQLSHCFRSTCFSGHGGVILTSGMATTVRGSSKQETRLQSGRQADYANQRRRDLHVQPRRREHARLLLHRDWTFSAGGVRQADPSALMIAYLQMAGNVPAWRRPALSRNGSIHYKPLRSERFHFVGTSPILLSELGPQEQGEILNTGSP
jgi:hypothetical protein